MGDHGHHDPGGHELEAINTKLLFRLLISLSAVTLLAAIAVVQWFYSQRRELEGRYAAEGSFQLQTYKTKMDADLEGVERVGQDIVANPSLLAAPPPPPGWQHPDDLVGGGAAAKQPEHEAPEHEAAHEGGEEVEPVPVELPKDGEPADEPSDDDAAEPEPAKQDKPAKPDDEPEKPAKQDKPEKPAKPADDKPEKPAKPAKPEPSDDGE